MNKKEVGRFFRFPAVIASMCALVILISCMAGIAILTNKKCKTELTFTQVQSDKQSTPETVFVTFTVSKSWTESDGSVGAQYDGVMTNTGSHPFTGWSVTAAMPKGYRIDSSWNGVYIPKEDELVIYPPAEYNRIVPPGKNITFGFVMYTPTTFNVQKLSFCGKMQYRLNEDPWFIASATATVIIVLSLAAAFCIMSAVKKKIEKETQEYIIRQKHDSAIIAESMKTFANFVDAKDPYTRGHSVRVSQYAEEIAWRLGITGQELQNIRYMGLLHDVGKISIPDTILNKRGKLTDDEWKEIQNHTTKGAEMLKDFSSIPHLRDAAHYHHEKWDGSGYPEHLSGKDIPLAARIICVADSFDAMSSDRCYRKRLDKQTIVNEFKKNAGTQFDPEISVVMLSMIEDGFTDNSH